MGAEPIGSFGDYAHLTFRVPAAVRKAAVLGLKLGSVAPNTKVGRHRARQLSTGSPKVTLRDIVYIRSYLKRHAVDIKGVRLDKDKPTKGWVAWLYWGGTPAVAWVNKIYNKHIASGAIGREDIEYNEGMGKRGKATVLEEAPVDSELAYDEYDGAKGLLVRTAVLPVHPNAPRPERQLIDTKDVYKLLRHLGWADREHMVVIAMDNGNRVLGIQEAAIGGVAAVSQSWPLLYRMPLLVGATRVILAHNHPGGTTGRKDAAEPSKTDKKLAKMGEKAFARVGLDLVDVVIISADSYSSLLA